MKILIHYNGQIDLAKEISEKAANYLLSRDVKCVYENDLVTDEINTISTIITFGGDGTILSAARKYIANDIPIMGFNVGKLGFLAEFSALYVRQNIYDLLEKKYKIIKRFLLSAQLRNEKYLAINDFVIRNTENSKLITLSAFANEQYIGDYRADGLIISTPTGSTAYSMACGGPIVCPDAAVYCMTPISPHTLTLRPLVIPVNKNIIIKLAANSNDNANVIADGIDIGKIRIADNLEITMYDKEAKFIVPLESNYFSVLRKKLLWAEKIV